MYNIYTIKRKAYLGGYSNYTVKQTSIFGFRKVTLLSRLVNKTLKGVIPMGKEYLKKTGEELQQYLQFRRRGSRVEAKKGKGAEYNRGREKDKARKQENE